MTPPPPTAKDDAVPRPVLEVGRLASLDEIEGRLERLGELGPDADLLLPSNLSGRFLGGTGGALQLIVSWRRRCPEGRLRVHVQEDADPETERRTLEAFLATDHGLVAAALSGAIWSRRGERELGAGWQVHMRGRFAEMDDASGLLRGSKGFALCLDDSPFEAPRSLYAAREPQAGEPPRLLGRKGFADLTDVLAARLWSQGPAPELDGLTSLLYELFRNTHDWARSDEREVRYRARQSVRGIRIERHGFPLADQEKMAAGQPGLHEYLDHPALGSPDGRQRLVEVSIFDSGPGVAARRLLSLADGGPAEPDLEGRALRDCLRKHISTSPESLGTGLHRALKALSDARAFLLIRSGRLSMLRDFITTPYRPASDPDEPFLADWMAGIGGVTARAPVAGASITALIPIRDRHVQTTL